MPRRVLIIQGHPDEKSHHLCHALADAYVKGCEKGGHEVRRIEVGQLAFPLLRTKEDFEHGSPAEDIVQAQKNVLWADHLVLIFPLWLGGMPAILKGFCEQVFRPAFAFEYDRPGGMARKLLGGKSARLIVTMGMPALVYRWFYLGHGVKAVSRNILKFCGFRPVKETLFGFIEGASRARRARWLDTVRKLGELGR